MTKMLKKLTIGFGLATVILFITTLILVPFSVKQQIRAFEESEDFNFNNKEFEIEATQEQYQFVFKRHSGVTLDASYDDKIHIDFRGYSLGKPSIESNEMEDKGVVILDRDITTNAHKLFEIINDYQEITIYVPADVTVDLLGNYHIRSCSHEVQLSENEMYDEDYDIHDGNYFMYKQAARYNSDDEKETTIKKLTYAGYLIATDYAQEDLDKPMYIDYTMKLKEEVFKNAVDLFSDNLNLNYDVDKKLAQNGVNYVDKQLILTYAIERQKQENVQNDEAQIATNSEGNYEIILSNEQSPNSSNIESLKQDVENARGAFSATLASNGVVQQADYFIDLFKI